MEGDLDSVSALTFSPGSPPPDSFARIVYSVGFAWRLGPWNAGGNGRRSVRWYADCLLDFVHAKARTDLTCRFEIHVHGSLPNLEDIAEAARRSFRDGRRRGGSSRYDPRGIRIVVCDPSLPAMWPQAARLSTLVDHPSHVDAVVVCDLHDDLRTQGLLVEKMLSLMMDTEKGLGLTFWKSEGMLSDSFLSDPKVLPPPSLRVDRTAKMVEEDRHWSLDAGLALSTGHFRSLLRREAEESFSSFLDRMSRLVNYDETRGTDEGMLASYLLSAGPSVSDLVRNGSLLFTHTLRGRSSDPPRRIDDPQGLPSYRNQPILPLSFAYDGEAKERLTSRRLVWEAKRATGKRRRGGESPSKTRTPSSR